MAEHGFYHPDVGYWQTVSDPSEQVLAEYPPGTAEIPIKPGEHYEWNGSAWQEFTPDPDDVRAKMPPLTPRRFRDALIDNDIVPDDVTAAIQQISDSKERAKALNAWEYALEFVRTDPLVGQIAEAFDLSPERIDTMWQQALVA